MGGSLQDDLLGGAHASGRDDRFGGSRGRWLRRPYNRNCQQKTPRPNRITRPSPWNSLVRVGTSFAQVVSQPKEPSPEKEPHMDKEEVGSISQDT